MSGICLDCTAKHILRKIVQVWALPLISRTVQFFCFVTKKKKMTNIVEQYTDFELRRDNLLLHMSFVTEARNMFVNVNCGTDAA